MNRLAPSRTTNASTVNSRIFIVFLVVSQIILDSSYPATKSLGKNGASERIEGINFSAQCPVNAAGSNGRCNTIWYKAVFKGGVYETRETVWVFGGAETRRVASLEGRADAA